MNRLPPFISTAIALGALTALLSACGPRIDRPVCKQRYADCTDACAERCDRRIPGRDDNRGSTFEDNDPAHADCASCVQSCRSAAERCDRQLPTTP